MIDTQALRYLAMLHRAMEGHTRAALLDAAADELDALRADPDAHRDEALKEAAAFDAANAAVARLRAALTQIAANSVEDEWERFGDPHASKLDAVRRPPGMEEMTNQLQGLFQNLGGARTKRRKLRVQEAMKLLGDEEAAKLVNDEDLKLRALHSVEQNGIVFIDEMDKVTSRSETRGPDVSREGVQRDLLPLVEGSTVSTKHGMVKTDHILFIASGAFHLSKPSDLIPELQGRLPIRVELVALNVEDFVRILTEPDASLTDQYSALLATEGVQLEFSQDGVVPVDDLAKARAFYGDLLGCPEGRSSPEWVDFDFYGHQIVAHLAPNEVGHRNTSVVDGDNVPVRHFGAVLSMAEWQKLADKLVRAGTKYVIDPHVRFKGQAGEQATMFFLDPCGNALEFKAFEDMSQLFAK